MTLDEQIREKGYVILESVSPLDFVDALHDDLLELERKLGAVPAQNLFEGNKTVRIYNLLRHGELYERIPVHEAVLPVVEGVLDRGCLVSSLSAMTSSGMGRDFGPVPSLRPLAAEIVALTSETPSRFATVSSSLTDRSSRRSSGW